MNTKLKPCPFCGKLPNLSDNGLILTHYSKFCPISVEIVAHTPEQSIEGWNYRKGEQEYIMNLIQEAIEKEYSKDDSPEKTKIFDAILNHVKDGLNSD